MPKSKDKMLTMEDLVNYFSKTKIKSFSYAESGKPIVVKSIQDFAKSDIEESDDGKMYCKVKVCHTQLNRNGSFISEDNMKKAMPTLKYSPLLANIHQLDNGEWDFHSHDMHIDDDDELIYDESQIGTFTVDEPYLEYDEEMDKTYVIARVAIPTEYTRAASIIKEKGGTKVSCELAIYNCSYNSKEKYLELEDFIFMGCTCLGREKDGTEIGEGMLGSKLTLEDFRANDDLLNQIFELQERLSKVESACFNIYTNSKEGGAIEVDKDIKDFEEVTDTEKVTETEETTEEEVTVTENASEEAVDETSEETTKVDEESDEEVEAETEDNAVIETEKCKPKKKCEIECSYEVDGEVKKFAVSLQEKIYAIQDLINATYAEVDNTYYGVNVYDDYVVMQDWCNGRFFKQSYNCENDSYSLVGDRVEVYVEFVTEDEQKELDSMRSNYASLVEFKENVEKAEAHSKREELLSQDKYSILSENKTFAKLVEEMDNYSLEDLEKEAKIIYADHVSEVGTFALSDSKKVGKISFSQTEDKTKSKAYGTLFK